MKGFGFGHRGLAIGTAAIAALVAAGGIAYASIPDASKVFSACMLNGVGTIRLIDKSLPSTNFMSHCTDKETEVSWNQKGQDGAPGAPGATGPVGPAGPAGKDGTNGTNGTDGKDGVSVTSTVEPAGANCANGGSSFTAVNGVQYVCNGAKGDTGDQGPAGPIGPQGFPGPAGPPGPNSVFNASCTKANGFPGKVGITPGNLLDCE